MKPLNEKERTKMMIQFIGFFILALLFFVIPIVFAKKIQVKEKVAYQKTSNEYIQKDKLASKLDSALSFFIKYKSSTSEVDYTTAIKLLVELQTSYNSDSSSNNIHFKTMGVAMQILNEYSPMLKEYVNRKKDTKNVDNMQSTIDRLKDDLQTCKNDFSTYRTMHP